MTTNTEQKVSDAAAPPSCLVFNRFQFAPARGLVASLIVIVLTGCAGIPAQPGFADVQRQIEKRLDQRIQWNQGKQADDAVQAALRDLLRDNLTLDEAIQIALLNNPSLQATYEKLGVAQADLVQAGLLANPVFSARRRTSGEGINREFAITQDFLSLFTLAPRKQLAASVFEKTKLEVGQEILGLAAEVKAAYYTVEGDEQALELFHQVVTASQAAAELAQRQYQAGNLSKREQALQQAFYSQTLLDLTRTETQLVSDREKLNRLLGLWGEDTRWQVPKRMPDVPDAPPAFDKLESVAITQRLDLAALKKEREIVASSLGFSQNYRLLSALGIGYSYERETDGNKLRGPNIELGLPLFDRSQGNLGRLEAQLRETERRLETLAIGIRSEVRDAYNRVVSAQEVVKHYRAAVLPLQQRIVGETLKFYNGMLLGVYDLLRAKQDQVSAGRDYIAAIKHYWLAYVDLEKALGGRAPGTEPATSDIPERVEQPEPMPAEDHSPHHRQ